jgi:hypothetical protein
VCSFTVGGVVTRCVPNRVACDGAAMWVFTRYTAKGSPATKRTRGAKLSAATGPTK